ncbi:DeoR/GlpR family DNA-binding transcription regulator [uncultured Faecalibaculum sp.]|uniref:DeoR/GlpR family DNA-binding transcription regulator n=1 Tax=uncultured Faecalibaculum sp. TaxID=1729681 RepID=UPI0027316005|nr:DeoR/GlpR family DNA-binding transcription regulator [uncultured Faecalibaculum sp.]
MNNSKRARERQNEIREILQTREVVSVIEFCSHFGVSIATIRNDLAYLEGKGYLQRVKGGAMSCEGKARSTSMDARLNLHKTAKARIAKDIVANEIKPGMTLILDAGSSGYYVAKELAKAAIPCTVITPSAKALMMLAPMEGVQVCTPGGKYDSVQDTWHDEDALNCLKDIHADLYIMSPDGICDGQYNTSDESENEIKKQFVAMSDRIVAAADGSKMGRPGDYVICLEKDVDKLYTEPVRSVIRSIND